MPTTDTVRNPKYSAVVQQAVVAAVATGLSLEQAAHDFGIHRNTVQRWCAEVRKLDNPANPLAADFKPRLIQKAVIGLEAGLDCRRDPYKRAAAAIKTLEGTGVFTSKVETQLEQHITITWGQASPEPIDVTPSEPLQTLAQTTIDES